MDAPNTEVYLALISMIGGVIGTYFTVKYKNSRAASNAANPARSQADRESTLYDGYERLIKQIEGNLDSVKQDLEDSEKANVQLRSKLESLEGKVEELREKLSGQTTENNDLRVKNTRLMNLAQAAGLDTSNI